MESLFLESQQLEPKVLPRPQASLLGQARCALGYGIDSARFARRFGIVANENHQPSCRNPLFSRHTAFYRTDEAAKSPYPKYIFTFDFSNRFSFHLKIRGIWDAIISQISVVFFNIFSNLHLPDIISLLIS